VLLNADQLPTLWDLEELYLHVALWAGVPVGVTVVVTWLLGLVQSARGWSDLATSLAQKYQIVASNVQEVVSTRKRAAMRLAVCSVLVVGFSYALAVVINVLVRVAEIGDPSAIFSSKVVENTVVATEWSPAAAWTVVVGIGGVALFGFACIAGLTGLRKLITFLGGFATIIAFLTGGTVALGTLFGVAGLALGGSDPPPKPLLVTEAIIAALLLALGYVLPGVAKAGRLAFNVH
jgi:hypothetical protein